jgi:predicted LPLAT superfamily acyltransferase
MSAMRVCAIVPSHNHWRALPPIVETLRAAGLPVYIVDDGSAEPAKSALQALHDPERGVVVSRQDVNQGKGAAVLSGFRRALDDGFTHAIQVDADGQHDLAALPRLLAAAERHPTALVSGEADYDQSVPLGRKFGRWITHFWVWIETLSFRVRDSMCGFRVYPLAAVQRLLDKGVTIGRRMDFDTEILVRLFWIGTPMLGMPVRVIYPPGNLSNFDYIRDNWRITRMHTRLVVTMLLTLPWVLANRPPVIRDSSHWSTLAERGLYWGLRLGALLYSVLGRRGSMLLLSPVVLYFYLTGTQQRRASRDFLRRALGRDVGFRESYAHFRSFTGRALDTFAGWTGKLPPDSIVEAEVEPLRAAEASREGALFIISHHGNVDVTRATLDPETRRRLVVLVHTHHAQNYNRVLREFNPEAAINTFQVTDMGPDTAIAMQERVEKGDWLFIAGDRTPVGGGQRFSTVPFLGSPAPFSQGPYILAALLGCPVYLMFCRREGARFRLSVERFADRIALPRGRREQALADYAARYALRLEAQALADPYQWYNFFDFWAQPARVDAR